MCCHCNSNEGNKIKTNENGVHAAFYNSKGNRIAVSTSTGNVILTDKNLHVLSTSFSHHGNVNSCFFSLDDKHIITGGSDKFIRRWNAETLQLENKFDFNFNSYTTIHGYSTICGCGENGILVTYHLAQRKKTIRNLEMAGSYHLFYVEPDSIIVVCSGINGYEYDITKNAIEHIYRGHTNQVYCIMPSNNKKLIITASADSTVKLFDRKTAQCISTSPTLDGKIYVASFSPNDSTIAASTSSGSIYFFDRQLASIKLKIKAFDTRINTIHYSPDGTRILAGSEGGGVKIFSTTDGKRLHELHL